MAYDELTDADLLTDPDRYRQLVAVMKRDGLLEEDDGRLRAVVAAAVASRDRLESMSGCVACSQESFVPGLFGGT